MWLKIILFSLSLVVYTEASVLFHPCSPASSPCNATLPSNIYVCNDGCCGQNDAGAGMCGSGSDCGSDCGCGCGCKHDWQFESSDLQKAAMACPSQCSCSGPSCQSPCCGPFPSDCLLKQMHCLIDQLKKCRLPAKCSGTDPRLAKYHPGYKIMKELGTLFDHLKASSACGNYSKSMLTRMGKQHGYSGNNGVSNEMLEKILKTAIADYKGDAAVLHKLHSIKKMLEGLGDLAPTVKKLLHVAKQYRKHK